MTPLTTMPNKVFNISTERFLRNAGDLFVYEGDYESALLMVEKTLEINPDEIRALSLKGDILYCLNRELEALDMFNRILSLNPDYVEALASKGAVLDTLGKLRESLRYCNRALNLLPAQHYMIGSLFEQKLSLLYRLRRFREAKSTLKLAASQLGPDELESLWADYKGQIEFNCQKRMLKHQQSIAYSQLKIVSNPGL